MWQQSGLVPGGGREKKINRICFTFNRISNIWLNCLILDISQENSQAFKNLTKITKYLAKVDILYLRTRITKKNGIVNRQTHTCTSTCQRCVALEVSSFLKASGSTASHSLAAAVFSSKVPSLASLVAASKHTPNSSSRLKGILQFS